MASTCNFYPYPKPCSHLVNCKENHGLIGYKSFRIPFKRSKSSIPYALFAPSRSTVSMLDLLSGDRMPYSPTEFPYSWWQHLASLAGYEQQDSHEFFISMLDRIHEKEQPNRSKGIGDCHCIVHRVFSGILRSDVTCTICGFTSTTYDPCVDISLNLEPSNACTISSGKS